MFLVLNETMPDGQLQNPTSRPAKSLATQNPNFAELRTKQSEDVIFYHQIKKPRPDLDFGRCLALWPRSIPGTPETTPSMNPSSVAESEYLCRRSIAAIPSSSVQCPPLGCPFAHKPLRSLTKSVFFNPNLLKARHFCFEVLFYVSFGKSVEIPRVG